MDERYLEVPGARDVADVLRTDPLYRLLGRYLCSPWVLGVTVALIVVLMVVFGPSSDSRFIYTDF
jgi:hypothetical protein